MKISLTNWIKQNRKEIDTHIKNVCPNNQYFNDSERRLWVLNDENLYTWAKRECYI